MEDSNANTTMNTVNDPNPAAEEDGLLTGKDRILLNTIACAIGRTSDVKLFETLEKTTADHARGFLEAASVFATDREVAMMYHIIQLFLPKFER